MPRLPAPAWLPLACAVLLTLRPGLGVLDYHACLVLAPIMGLCAAHLQLRAERRPLVWLTLALGPWLWLLAAGLWVPNCARWYGTAFYVLGPLASVLVGAGWGHVARWLPRRRVLGLYLLVLASAVPPLWAFLAGPQVFAYHGLVGFVAGAIYEDAVAIEPNYVLFRVLDLGLWLPVLALSHPRALRFDAQARMLAAVALTALGVAELRAAPERWRVSAAQIEAQELPVRIELPGLVLHLPAGQRWHWAPALAADDVAFRGWQLGRFFGRVPERPVHVFLYPSAAAKRRWMGADKVDLAKPWLGQVHLTMPAYGDSVLAHELAHTYAASLTRSPLGLPGRVGLPYDALLVEGVAMAAEWPLRDGADLHDWAAAMRRLGLAPKLEELLAPGGFLSQSGARAYTLAGSFVRWLYEHDPTVVARLYATGDVGQATGRPLTELARAWEAEIDARPLSDDMLERARVRFEPPGLFDRRCALAEGRCARRAARWWASGQDRKAADEWQALLDALPPPHDADWVAEWAVASVRAGRTAPALAAIERDLSSPTEATASPGPVLNRSQRAYRHLLAGDLRLQIGDQAGARAQWAQVELGVLSNGSRRSLGLRQLLTDDQARPTDLDLVRTIVASGGPPCAVDARLDEAMNDLPSDPTRRAAVRYLWGRSQIFRAQPTAAAEALRATLADTGPLATDPATALRRAEAERLLALDGARRGVCPRNRTPIWWLDEVLERCHWAHARAQGQAKSGK